MQSAKAILWLGLALAVGCESRDDRIADDGAGGMGGVDTPAGDVAGNGESNVAVPGPTPGGDTSDLGASPHPCGGRFTGFETVSLEEARARGFDPDPLLANVPGVIEADVRWDRPFAEPQTRVRVEFASDGTAVIAGWNCRAAWGASCYAGNVLWLNVGVSIETEDGRLQGRFVTKVAADSLSGSWVRRERGGDVYISASHGGSLFVGTFSLGDVDPASRASVRFAVLTTAGGELRAEVGVTPWTDGSINPPRFTAMPLDGCEVSAVHRSEPASPSCTEARFGSGSCCGGYLTRFPLPREPYPVTTIGTDLACLAPDPEEDAGLGEHEQELDAGTDPG